MAKFLKRLTQQKVNCMVEVSIKDLSVQVDLPTTLKIQFDRGQFKDASAQFEVTPDTTQYDVGHTFSRASVFYRDKSGKIAEKKSALELITVPENKKAAQKTVGKVEINLALIYGKSDDTHTYEFEHLKVIQSAQVTVSISVTELSKEVEGSQEMAEPDFEGVARVRSRSKSFSQPSRESLVPLEARLPLADDGGAKSVESAHSDGFKSGLGDDSASPEKTRGYDHTIHS